MARRCRRSIHQVIRYTVLGCVLLCALVSLWAPEKLSKAYDAELAVRQGYVQDQCFARVEECLTSAEWLSGQFIASDPIQQALKTISQSEGTTLAGARTSLGSAISSTAFNVPGYMRNIVLMDMQGNRYSYGSILNTMQLLEEIGGLMLRTPDDGSAVWYGLVGNGTEYMVLTRAIRESRHLSLELIGYEAICIDVRTMLGKIEVEPATMLDETEIYMDGLRLYRGEACPEVTDPAQLRDRQRISLGGHSYLVTRRSFLGGRMELIDYTNYDQIMAVVRSSRVLILLMMVALLVLMSVFALRAIDNIFNRMDRLTDAVSHLDENNLRLTLARELLESPDEVGILAQYLQKLMRQIDVLVNQRLKRQLYAARAQNRMLQAQIHPHFLYNTLETIHAMAAADGNEQISRISMSLSRLVRASFRGSAYVSLDEEIAFVQEYLTIYRIRFGERFCAMIDCEDEDSESILLPQMTLQPLVENSVRYGLMRKQGRGVIRLKIRHRGGRLRITLYDNGTGFPQEMIERYERMNLADELEIHGYGNVLCRLRFTYGDEAVVKVRSREGAWTNLFISIPDKVPDALLKEAVKENV